MSFIINPFVHSTAGGGGGVSGNPYITAQSLGTLRNNFTGSVGFRFTTPASSPPTVTGLGRWKVAGNSGTHTVYLLDYTGGGVVIESVSLNMSTGTDADYLYAALGTPRLLLVSNQYFICSAETNGGDQWYDSNTTATVTAAATLNGAAYDTDVPPSGGISGSFGGATVYGPVNFKYT